MKLFFGSLFGIDEKHLLLGRGRLQTVNGRSSNKITEDAENGFHHRMSVQAQNWHRSQTMTEYALIQSTVAVVVYAGYKATGTSITSLLTSVDGNL